MFRKDPVLKGLIALLGVFILGYSGLIAIHTIFEKIIEDLDNNVKNEYARYKIGEYILKEVGDIETQYYKMGFLKKIEELKAIQKDLKQEIKDIKNAIYILENGGILKNYIKLNILEIREVTEIIHFKPDSDSKYTLESIDLIPKLNKLTTSLKTMENMITLKISINNTKNKKEIEDKIFELEPFFKKLPTLFIKMKENTSRLLYDSKKNLDKLEKNIKKEKTYYKDLEYIITYFVMILAILLGYIVIKQILKKSKKLELMSKKAKEAAKEAQKANETKSQFLANMSHEIRTPLNAIIGFSDILANSNLEQKDKEKAEIIVKSANALLNIINDILDISKIESGKYEISNKKFNLKNLLEQVVQLYSVNTKQKDIRFIYKLDEKIPSYINSDETKIKQVLSNILSNAIKFTPNEKKIFFEVKLLNLKKETAKVRFSIKDEGIGISLTNQKKIFEPFSQADGSISRKFGGTGLGLAICLNIIKILGSRIYLISKENQGSTFYFDLNLKIEEENIVQKNIKNNFLICNILKDNEEIRKHLISILKTFGNVFENDEEIEKSTSIDLIFYFGDPDFTQKLEKRKKYFNCPIVYVGDKKKIENHEKIKSLIDYEIDIPIYGSKIFNIIANSKSFEKEPKKIENSKSKSLYQGNILVAEDNANNQLLIKLLLEDLKIKVTITQNGKEAYEQYVKEYYDLVFLDINMPIMDGLTALKLIRKYENKIDKYTPIIALTANTIKGDKEKYLKEGMDNYLAKPIEKQKLIEILNLYLDKKSRH